MNTLLKMDISKGRGPDEVHPLILKRCAETLTEPLTIMFNKSLESCVYPNKWKIGQLTPIFKSGNKSDFKNYRGVNVMPNLAKVFEKVLHNILKLIITPHLSNNQHGFLSRRNIETNLMELSVQITDAFETRSQVDVFYADISKAFDAVDQSLLIRKIAKYSLDNSFLKWLISYFDNRTQYVRVNNDKSSEFTVPSSVGQGTILGPLFFLVFFDDSDDNLSNCSPYNFADDKKIAKKINSIEDAQELQRLIDNFSEWCRKNGLQINLSKCKVITFTHKKQPIIFDYTIDGQKIERVNQIRDLGVILDSELNFVSHTEYITKKAHSVLSFVRRISRNNFGTDVSKLLYMSLVRSNMEFASTIWTPYQSKYKKSVESVQKQAIMFLNGDYISRSDNNYKLAPYSERCKKLDLTSLIRRRINMQVLFIHKILQSKFISERLRGEITLYEGTRSLRCPEFIRFKQCKTDYALNSPFNLACRAYNHAVLLIDPTLPYHEFERELIALPDSIFGELCKLAPSADVGAT